MSQEHQPRGARDYRRATLKPSTARQNEAGRWLIDIVLSTGATVKRGGWFTEWDEELMTSGEGVEVDLSRAQPTLVHLRQHNTWRLEAVLGRVHDVRLEGRDYVGTLELSDHADDEPVVYKIVNGFIRDISIGYDYDDEDVEVIERDGMRPLVRIKRWALMESSSVVIGADPGAKTRSKGGAPKRAEPEPAHDQSQGAAAGAGDPSDHRNSDTGGSASTSTERSEMATITVEEHQAELDAAKAQARREAEQFIAKREAVIGVCQRKLGLTDEQAAELKGARDEKGNLLDPAALRARAFEMAPDFDAGDAGADDGAAAATAGTRVNGRVTAGGKDERDHMLAGWREAILARAMPRKHKHTELSQKWRGMGPRRMAEHFLRSQLGYDTQGMSDVEIVRRAMAYQAPADVRVTQKRSASGIGIHTTADFQAMLAGLMHDSLLEGYMTRPPTFTEWARRTSFQDLRKKRGLRLGLIGDMPEVLENEPYTRVKVGESYEEIAPKKHGFIIGYSWELALQDNLDFLALIPNQVGQARRRTESNVFYRTMFANPTLIETTRAMFHAKDGSSATGVGAPGGDVHAQIKLLVKAMALREAAKPKKAKSTDDYGLDFEIETILCPFGLQDEWLEELGQTFSSANTDNGKVRTSYRSINVIPEARIDRLSATSAEGDASTAATIGGTSSFAIAGGAMGHHMAYGYLDGEENGFMVEEAGFEVDAVEVKFRHVFGAGPDGNRGIIHHAGVAAG